MSWESATNVLFTKSPTIEQIEALEKFLTGHGDQLKHCYDPKFREQRPIVSRFLSQLFVLLENQDTEASSSSHKLQQILERGIELLTRGEFFKGVFQYALSEGDVSLLELVYSSLFTEIVFNSSLTCAWFEQKASAEKAGTVYSPLSQALILLVSVQFLDVRQNWSASQLNKTFLKNLDKHINSSSDLSVKMTWNLALFFMAKSYYTSEKGDDGHGIEDLMQKMQAMAGVHWSDVLRDQLQVSLAGVPSLVVALAVVKDSTLQIVKPQLLSQTVADVISCLFEVSKPTESLCFALSQAVSPWPALQQVHWVDEGCLSLTKAKCPSSIAALVSFAQTMDISRRAEYLREMKTYVCVVDSSSLDLPESLNGTMLGQDVRANQLISILPPRPTDHQGTLELDINTRGTLLAYDGAECLVMWYFTYNGWSLLGRIFENADLNEDNDWQPLTVEILKLITMTPHLDIQATLSAGLARGDVFDLVAFRLQSWLHINDTRFCEYAFDYMAQMAVLDPARIWVLLSTLSTPNDRETMLGLKKLLLAVWPSFDTQRSLHVNVTQKLLQLFVKHFLPFGNLDISVLPVFELVLPVSPDLQEDLLGSSDLRETSVFPFLQNLDCVEVLNFCTYCVRFAHKLPTDELSYMEKQLFVRSKQLVSIFKEDQTLRVPILHLWATLMQNPQSPPLLAFMEPGQAQVLKKELSALIQNKLESLQMIDAIALFVFAAGRQESLLDLVRDPLLALIENRVLSVEDPRVLNNLMKTLSFAKPGLKPATLSHLQDIIKKKLDAKNLDQINLKITSIKLLTTQFELGGTESLKTFIGEIGSLIPQLCSIEGVRPSLYRRLFHNLKSKWPNMAAVGDSTATFEPSITEWDAKLEEDPMWQFSYRHEMVEALDNKQHIENQAHLVAAWCQMTLAAAMSQKQISSGEIVSWSLKLLQQNSLSLPLNLQYAEEQRTETTLRLLSIRCEANIELLEAIYHQLTELSMTPSVSLHSLNSRLLGFMKMAALVLSEFKNGEDPKLTPVLLGILDVVVIKELQIFGSSEDTLRLHLLLLRNCLRLLKDPNAARSLVQSMTESGCDSVILRSFAETPVDSPVRGELLMLYVQEWLPTEVMTDNFVRNGLMNVLIESPLGRRIQMGGVHAAKEPALHSLWRQGMLTVILRLLSQLKARISQEAWLFVSIYAAQISTCMDQWRTGQISIALIEETLLLYALTTRLSQLDSDQNDKVEINFDHEELIKSIDVLLSHQKYLVARTAKTDDLKTVVSALRDLKDLVDKKEIFL